MLRVMKTFWLYLTGIWLYLTGKPHRDGQFARQIPSLSEMAESSSSAAANSDHDVFISHRGPDAKKTFASHLYNRLCLHGLRVFLDQAELRRGDDFSVQIEHAIRSASVHVAIFSQGYADSRWCLDELLQMLNTEAPIIPVFYHVKPDELRGTRGKKRTYAEALDDLASKTDYDGQTPRHDPSKIQKWREALRQVADISGFELEACNGHLYSCGTWRLRLWEEELEPPLQLRDLEIKALLSHIPNSIGQRKHLERIVICHVIGLHITITELPEEFCGLRSLKVLVLEGWSRMEALPKKFGNLTELQHLQLSTCSALKSLPESFGELTNLQHIQLSSCTALDSLPESFGNLTNLYHLELSECSALKRLPESFGKLSNLQHIKLPQCSSLERLPDSFCKLIKLQHLDLHSCCELSLQRETLGNISTLKYIDLSECRKIEVLPSQVAHQRSLEQLRLRGTNLKELPSAIGQLSCMEVLELGEDPLLDKLPFQLYDLKKLKELRIEGWQELKVLPDALCDLKNLKELRISGCKKLKCLPPLLGDLSNLNKLEIFRCHELNRLPTSIGRLTQLTHLRVCGCPLIRELPLKEEVVRGKRGTLNDFQILPRLRALDVSETGISEVSFAERVCCNLQFLSIERCNNVVEVEVGKFPNTLIYLSFSGCVKLKNIRGLGKLKLLSKLYIARCSDLEEVEGIQDCRSFQIIAGGCPKLQLDADVNLSETVN